MKNVLKGILGFHIMRHRQHRRFIHSLAAPAIALGRTKGMLMVGALALGAELLRRRKARSLYLPEHPE